MKKVLLFVVCIIMYNACYAGETVVEAGDERKDVMLYDKEKAQQYMMNINGKDITVYFTHIKNNKTISLLVPNWSIPKENREGTYNGAIIMFQEFLKKFRLSGIDTEYIGINFFKSDIIVALDAASIKMLDSRDWGADDIEHPEGKVPFKKIVKKMVVFDYNNFEFNSEKTQEFKLVAEKFDGYSLFDAFIEAPQHRNTGSSNQHIINGQHDDGTYYGRCGNGDSLAIKQSDSNSWVATGTYGTVLGKSQDEVIHKACGE